jgi:hypothetical protein
MAGDRSMTIEYKDSKRIVANASSMSKSGCLAYYNFEQTGSTLTNQATTSNGYSDGVGSNADGTNTGQGGFNGATTNVTGKVSKCWDFDRSSDSAGDYVSGINLNLNGAGSISVWVNISLVNYGEIIGRGGAQNLVTYADGHIYYHGIATSAGVLSSNTWHHIVGTIDSSNNAKIYVDNVLEKSATGGSVSDSTLEYTIGTRNVPPNKYYQLDGKIDELSVWSRELTTDEISALYNSGDGSTIDNTLVPETKPTDVQDNSILVEKDVGRRYWFNTTKLVFEDDFSSYASQSAADAVYPNNGNTSVGQVNITNDVIDATGNVSTVAGVVRDIGAVGSTFVLRFKIVITTASQYSSGDVSSKLNIGLFSTNEDGRSAEELIALDVNAYDNNYRFKAGGSVTPDAGGSTGAGGYTTETRWVEIKRLTGGDCKLSIFTTDAYTTSVLEGSKTLTPTGTITSALKYFGVKSGNSGSGDGSVVLTIDDISFWNNTTVPFNDTWTMQPTLEYDLSTSAGWSTTGSNCSVNTSGQYLEGSSSTDNDRATKALGLTLSDTKFVVRQKMELADVTTGGNGQLYFGYTDKDNSTTVLGSRDAIGITIRTGADFLQSYALNQAWQSSVALNTTPTETTYYLEIIRDSATSHTINLYSDSDYSVLIETKTNTISSSINGLEYITIGGWDNNASGNITARFSNIEIYNGVNTLN